MENELKEPPRIAVKFANMVFVLGILYSILVVVYATYKIYNIPENVLSLPFYIFCILSAFVFATLFGFGLKRLSNNLKVNLSILFFTVGITFYGFEIYLEFSQVDSQKKVHLYQAQDIAKQMGVPYDTRTKMEVLYDLRDSGIEAFPNVHPSYLLEDITTKNGLSTRDGMIFPLNGISNKVTVQTNENGYWMMYKADKYGFHNSNDVYQDNVDILLTGDSFGEGLSVKSEENIGGVLQEIGFNVVNISKSGNSSLLEFAALKEYAEPLKPKIVLWLYYVNDIGGLDYEMTSSILRKYLNEDGYSQNLMSRQEEIDDILKKYVQNEWLKVWKKEKEKEKKLKKKRVRNMMINLLKLSELRKMINLTLTSTSKSTLTSTSKSTLIISYRNRPIFRNILQKSNQMVSVWNGKMYFVYLPSFFRYLGGNEHHNRDFVMQTATELDIPIIDIHEEVFDLHQDPLSLFPFSMYGHYNVEGYKLVAEAIGKRLEKDGYVSIKSKK